MLYGMPVSSSLLQQSLIPALWFFSCAQAFLSTLIFFTYRKTKEKLFLPVGALALGLFYDFFLLALGSTIGEGTLILALTRLRYILYGGLFPITLLVCALTLKASGGWMKATWITMCIFMLFGIVNGCLIGLTPTANEEVFRYAAVFPAIWSVLIHYFFTFGVILSMLVAGIAVWRREKTPRLFIAGFFVLLYSCVAIIFPNTEFYSPLFGNFMMILYLYMQARWNAQISWTE